MTKIQPKLMLTHIMDLLVTELIQIVSTMLLAKDSHLSVPMSVENYHFVDTQCVCPRNTCTFVDLSVRIISKNRSHHSIGKFEDSLLKDYLWHEWARERPQDTPWPLSISSRGDLVSHLRLKGKRKGDSFGNLERGLGRGPPDERHDLWPNETAKQLTIDSNTD